MDRQAPIKHTPPASPPAEVPAIRALPPATGPRAWWTTLLDTVADWVTNLFGIRDGINSRLLALAVVILVPGGLILWLLLRKRK